MVVMMSTIFWDRTPCSLLKVNRHFGGTYRTRKMEAILSSETSIDFQWATPRYKPKVVFLLNTLCMGAKLSLYILPRTSQNAYNIS
jgi:hypothetical protein